MYELTRHSDFYLVEIRDDDPFFVSETKTKTTGCNSILPTFSSVQTVLAYIIVMFVKYIDTREDGDAASCR